MNTEVVQQIVYNIGIIYDPTSTNENRRIAQEFCEQLKEDPSAPFYGHHVALFSNRHSDVVRYFGLSLVENAVRFKWHESYSPSDKAKIVEALVSLVRESLMNAASEKRYIKEKTARIFAELVEREWPQRWPGLELILRELFSVSHEGKCVTANILRYIAEDVFIYTNPVTVSRKDDLRNALITILAKAPASLGDSNILVPIELYEICGVQPKNDGWIKCISDFLSENTKLLSLATGSEKDKFEDACCICVNSLASFLEWIPHTVLLDSGLVFQLFSLLLSPSKKLRQSASEAVLLITARKFSDFEHSKQVLLTPILQQGGIDVFMEAWKLAGGNGENIHSIDEHLEEDYPFLKRLAQIWYNIGCDQLCFKKAAHLPSFSDKFLDVFLHLTAHPSLTIGLMSLNFWCTAFKHEVLYKSDIMKERFIALYDVVAQRLNKIPYLPSEEENALLSSRYSKVDFPDSLTEFQTAFGSLRSTCHQALRTLVVCESSHAIQHSASSLQCLFELPIPYGDNSDRNRYGNLTVHAPYYLKWETVSAELHAVLSCLPKLPSESSGLQVLFQMFNALLAFEIYEPLIVGRQLDALTDFSSHLKEHSDVHATFSLLKKIFQFVTFTSNTEPKKVDAMWEISEDSHALRRKACTSLLRLAVSLADQMSSIYDQISKEVARLDSEHLVCNSERAYLADFLTTIIHHSSSISDDLKSAAHAKIFEPIATQLCNPSLISILSDMKSFMEYSGLTFLSNLHKNKMTEMKDIGTYLPELNNYRMARSDILSLVNTYKNCLSRTIRLNNPNLIQEARFQAIRLSPWGVHFQQVLPAFFLLLKNIHSIWDNGLWTGPGALPKECSIILQISPLERAVILGASPTDAAEEEQQKSSIRTAASFEQQLHYYREWLRLSREVLYHLFGQATFLVPGPFFYSQISPISDSPTFANAILVNVFGTVDMMSTYHWRILIHCFFRNFILNCPSDSFESILSPILPQVIEFLANKLNSEWKSLCAKPGAASSEFMKDHDKIQLDSPDCSTLVLNQGEISEEIVQQKCLRDLTRTWLNVWFNIFLLTNETGTEAPSSPKKAQGERFWEQPKGSKKNTGTGKITDFGRFTELVEYLLSKLDIVERLFTTLLYAITWKDTRTATQSARVLSKVVSLLAKHDCLHSFFGKDLVEGALHALSDGYHQEGHDVFIGLVTEIYVQLRPHTDIVANTLSRLVPTLSDPEVLKKFDSKVMTENGVTLQKKLFRDMLREVMGVKPGQWFRKLDASSSAALVLSVPEKLFLTKRSALSRNDDQNQDDLGLLDLFAK